MNHILEEVLSCINRLECNNAFYINGKAYSYSVFGERVSIIRQAISSSGIEGEIIGLAIHDDLDTYASVFALWMEGKAYVPLHPYHPIERNISIIKQIGLTHIIDTAEESHYDEFSIINPSCLPDEVLVQSPIKSVSDKELAYILFTSGSTGTPKGVCISRGNVAAFLDSFWRTGITINATDRCLQCFDLTFDVSVQSFLVALTRGACVYTVPYGQVKYLYVAALIQEQRISFGAMAPSMLAYLRPFFNEIDASSLKTCILTAEACPVDLLEDWFSCASNADIYDFYGPTECTIYCTYYKLSKTGSNLSCNGVISIGEPFYNVLAVIIDEYGNNLTMGQKGELCIAGKQLSPGYWNTPEKNANAFFNKSINGKEYRFYHTGDLCYWDASGNIMYLGRLDQQAKIQGFRVELSEIEFHAREYYKRMHQVVAIAYNGKNQLSEIALFIESNKQDKEELLNYLRSKMPNYMIPSLIVFEEKFPTNSSDKIDRNRLKEELSEYD